ncbi:hypothetical protein P152DRAFT_341288 [Eremomyces bilateralis CBS 781.70]|uniref:RecQ-mediated genome instability protein 1 n=1 Tax=Eremomyces bilateralis CBS 781.70 TaxID=1392243 RepID=A0A6G1G3C6_9PEZI|nr:uncharacterized protein P152DRAFT_341288 [Eremomyces bilateralis CBS 781.70]KAF1812492.1 hypothetical protein P152DRAFT_341288 [Eremomyces bilateralis CBS 781.70]
MPPTTHPPINGQAISDHLVRLNLHPSPSFLHSFISSQTRNLPINAVCHSARFRILNADIRECLSPPPNQLLPRDLTRSNPHDLPAQERHLAGPFVLQIAWVEDIGKSKWSQLTEWEQAKRDEGREKVVGLADADSDDAAEATHPANAIGQGRSQALAPKGPFKLHLHDAQNPPAQVHGVTVGPIEGINVDVPMGGKILVKDVVVARGVMLLDSSNTTLLGGKVHALATKYKEGRIDYLRRHLEGDGTVG